MTATPTHRATTTALSWHVLKSFAALCEQAAKDAVRRGRPILASWTTAVPELAVVEQVRHLGAQSGRTFVWASSWSGQRRLSVGAALDVAVSGADRFAELSAMWSAYRDGALVGGTGRHPCLVGGFSFALHDDDRPSDLPDALMWLPAAELIEIPGSPPELTLNAWLRCAADVDAAVRQAEAAAHTLMSEPTVCGEPPAGVTSIQETPSALDWKLLVGRVLDEIAARTFDKLVLARQLTVEFDRPLAVPLVLASLLDQHRGGAVFGAQLGPRWFVGRTPECLLHVHDQRADTHGLAGSVPRAADPMRDAQLRDKLTSDPRLDWEHAIVADVVRRTLRGFFRDVRTDTSSPVVQLDDIQHRQTRIRALNPNGAPDLLRLAGALHPTPAVGGFPAAPALRWLGAHEPFDRGWYAAPIGWVGADGGGELSVAIRSALISGKTAAVYAGCGIVDGADPAEEYRESCTKMREMLNALGVPDSAVVAQ